MDKINALLWDEWLSVSSTLTREIDAEIVGLIQGMSELNQRKSETILLTTTRIAVFRKLRKIWSSSSLTHSLELANLLILPKNLKGRVVLQVPMKVQESIGKFNNKWDKNLSGIWLRGLWGPTGSFFKPKNGYYLLLRINSSNRNINTIKSRLSSLGLNFSSRDRLGGCELTLRNQESILEFLSHMNLPKTSIAVQEKSIFRSMRNFANKIVNCDSSNIKRSVIASRQQLELASKIEELGLKNSLPKPLKDVVVARLNNPSATLRELGQSLQDPISKSTVEYRWKKIKEILTEVNRGGSYNVPWKT